MDNVWEGHQLAQGLGYSSPENFTKTRTVRVEVICNGDFSKIFGCTVGGTLTGAWHETCDIGMTLPTCRR